MEYVTKILKDGSMFAVPISHIKKVNMTLICDGKWAVNIEVMDDIYDLYFGDSKEDAQKMYCNVLDLISMEK